MIRVVYHGSFLREAKRLTKALQTALAHQVERLSKNPFDPKLHTKRLTGPLAGIHSCRITRDWRFLFQFLDADCIQLLHVAHRKDIYR